ncbi:MAG: ribosome maturation factor RimM, partial [Saprospiraceae bacterium]|nr:ribosome maturation factor RimM [Saprospiraceae bacterium]
GELKIQIEEEYLEDFLQAEVIFLEISGKQVPYFIEKIRSGNEMLLKLEDINSREAATPLASKEIFLREEDLLPVEEGEVDFDYEDLIGFQIIDTEAGSIGKIEKVIEYPQQMMAVLQYQEREILIPLHENLIHDINIEEQTIIMNLPIGLLDL